MILITSQEEQHAQDLRYEVTIPHVAPRTVSEVMAKACQLDAAHVAFGDAQLWLHRPQSFHEHTSQVCDP